MTRFIKTAVIGHPVSHSKSPLIHQYWIDKYGLNGSYEKIDIAPDRLRDGLRDMGRQGFAGFNVTIPHKQTVMELCDDVDAAARAIGAVNTVVVEDDRFHGYNTDAYGFMENLRRHDPSQKFARRHAVVLGAGGAARAVVHGLAEAGMSRIFLTNRTFEKAREIAVGNSAVIEALPWEDNASALENASLLVNTSSLGMTGQPPLSIDIEPLPDDATICDIVYSPLKTPLLHDAQKRGMTAVTGIGMLLHQAVPAFERWYGIRPDVTPELEAMVLS